MITYAYVQFHACKHKQKEESLNRYTPNSRESLIFENFIFFSLVYAKESHNKL